MNECKLKVGHMQVVPSKILGPERNYINGSEVNTTRNFLIYTFSSDTVKMVESRKLRWFGRVDG
jgi:hypothetical protein